MSSWFNQKIEEDDKLLLKTAFIVWKNYHLRHKKDWRLEIKADVHYSLQLKLKSFKKWQLFILERFKEIIRKKISQIYYEKKIKLTYFLNLRLYVKERLYRRKTEPIIISGLIFCYSRIEVLIRGCIYINLRLNYLALKYDENQWRTKRLKVYFDKLLDYVNGRITKRNIEVKLRLFLRNKYDPEVLRPYLKFWVDFTKCATNRKRKLLRKSFLQLRRYKSYSQSKRGKIILATVWYEAKIKRDILRNWINFTNDKLLKANRIVLADSHYEHKLKRSSFIKWYRYKIYKQNKVKLTNFVEEIYSSKLKLHYYTKLKLYCVYSKRKRFKFNQACSYYDTQLKREIQYRNKLEVAKTVYEKHLLSKALAFVLKSGDRKQDFRKRKALDAFERDFQLQSKYYLIWKRKVLGNVSDKIKFNCGEVFEWNGLCFQQAKIPENLFP
ncbi:hypothetical protein QE152_g10378 [Popillia japonica]|uniref:Sfi1 spindle body domain-containing protein n=1 Tax=Popillia japonica TaxID=7064 RepID=A0AAW1LUK8_POPJA